MKSVNNLQQQHGAVLVISLLILLLMTLIGVTAVNVSTFEEKMAGNVQDKYFSFQQAEAALRVAEKIAENLSVSTTFDGSYGLHYPNTCYPCWDDPDSHLSRWSGATDGNNTAIEGQNYMVENMGKVPRNEACSLTLPPETNCYVPYYRTTGLGRGGLGDESSTKTIVQSTVKFIK